VGITISNIEVAASRVLQIDVIVLEEITKLLIEIRWPVKNDQKRTWHYAGQINPRLSILYLSISKHARHLKRERCLIEECL
jgi:hypothetical protein